MEKPQQETTPVLSRTIAGKPNRNLFVFNKRVTLSVLGVLAAGGLTSWIVNHAETMNHLRIITDYEKKMQDPAESPRVKHDARGQYDGEYDKLNKSINRVYFSAGLSIAVCIGIGLTFAF